MALRLSGCSHGGAQPNQPNTRRQPREAEPSVRFLPFPIQTKPTVSRMQTSSHRPLFIHTMNVDEGPGGSGSDVENGISTHTVFRLTELQARRVVDESKIFESQGVLGV